MNGKEFDFTKFQRDLEAIVQPPPAEEAAAAEPRIQFLQSDRDRLPENVRDLATAESFEDGEGAGEDDQLQILRDLLEEVRNLPNAIVEALRSS